MTDQKALCAWAAERLTPSATYQDTCRRIGALLGELVQAQVSVKFASLGGAPFSGATVRLADGSYVVYCASSRSWYHRMGILLHELSHVLLGHEPASLEGVRRQFLPHLPGRMARIVAARSNHTGVQEQEAEELADLLLARLTEHREPLPGVLPHASPRLRRIAEELAHLH
ncbi:hypothetical protein [Actinocorallia populi]|uniref:hypothetical protein n=1 Tax=Actinocorallia populi TaxID=2079200 RepID=UPI000D08ED29|nr:hypothetical protein [Actinocorallia populi]